MTNNKNSQVNYNNSIPLNTCLYNTDKVDIFKELKKNIKLQNNEKFFKSDIKNNKVVKIIDTGIGKTYNSAYLLLYTIFNTNNKIVISTTKNENLLDLENEIIKIIRENIEDSFLKEKIKNDFDLKKLFIYKLTAPTASKSLFDNARAIITNHSYFYNDGDSTEFKFSTKSLKKFIDFKTILLVDEFDKFDKLSYLTINLNKFIKEIKTDSCKVKRLSESAFISNDKNFYNENIEKCRYKLPELSYRSLFIKVGDYDTPKYIHALDGDKNIEDDIQNFYKEELEGYDKGRRKGFVIDDKFKLLRVDKVSRLARNDLKINEFDENGILSLLENYSNGNALVEQIIQIIDKDDTILEIFDNREDFMKWCGDFLSIKEYDNMLSKLLNEGGDLYKRKLVVKRKSILDWLNCKKYFYTATPDDLEKTGHILDYCKMKNPSSLEKIDVFFLQREKSENSTKNFILKKFHNKDYNILGFVARKETVDNIEKNCEKYKHIKVVKSDKLDDIEMKPYPIDLYKPLNDDEDNKIDRYITLSYLNGTESTGRNYTEKDVLIINSRPELNITARLAITPDKTEIVDIDEASLSITIQACGRIERTDKQKQQKYKAVVMIGDDITIAERYIKNKQGNGIEYELRQLDIIDIVIRNVEEKIDKYNKGFDVDIRVLKKTNYKEVKESYLNLIEEGVSVKEAKKEIKTKFKIDIRKLNKILKNT
jgi:hypothetical protein